MENYKRAIDSIIELVEESCFSFNAGGPFGALVFKDSKVIGRGVNKVLAKNDPTAHAEIEAIRDACTNLKTHDLSGCELYATGFPCPMCMSAIIWSNIKKVYYSADYIDAENIGFRDSYIYTFIQKECIDDTVLELKQVDKSSIIKLYNKFKRMKGEIY